MLPARNLPLIASLALALAGGLLMLRAGSGVTLFDVFAVPLLMMAANAAGRSAKRRAPPRTTERTVASVVEVSTLLVAVYWGAVALLQWLFQVVLAS